MWKKLREVLPHATIVFANMYVVFFLIDRVNTAMNFIDNVLTKGLLLAMCLLAVADWALAPRLKARKPRRARRMAGVAAVLCGLCLALLLADLIAPQWSLFLRPAVKWFLLGCCVAVIASAGALLARSRGRLRIRLRRKGRQAAA